MVPTADALSSAAAKRSRTAPATKRKTESDRAMDDHQPPAPASPPPGALSLEEMIQNTSRSRLAQLRNKKRKRTNSKDDPPPLLCCDNCSELRESSKRLEDPGTSDEAREALWDLLARELPDDAHLCDKDESPNVKALIVTTLHELSEKSSSYRRQAAKVLRVLVGFKQNHRALADCGGFATLVVLLAREETRTLVKQLALCLSELVVLDESYLKAINDTVESVVASATSPQSTAPEEEEANPVYLQNLARVYYKLDKVYVGTTKSVKRVMLVRDLMDVLNDGSSMAKLVAIAFFHNALHLTDPVGDSFDLAPNMLTTSYVLRESIEEIIDAAVDKDTVPNCKQLARNILLALAKNYSSAYRTIKAHQLLYGLDLLPPGV